MSQESHIVSEAWFKDRFGVIVKVEVPFSLEDLYVLWASTKHGAKISLLVRAGKRAIRLDIKALDHEKTFSEAIIAGYSPTIPPPPDYPTLPSAGSSDPPPSGERPTPISPLSLTDVVE